MMLLSLILLLMYGSCNRRKSESLTSPQQNKDAPPIRYDDQNPHPWPASFTEVNIQSTVDSVTQSAWFFATTKKEPQPLLVSLHTWSGDYNQKDTLAIMAEEENWNYIHPDFRGPNWTYEACCSLVALEDIDQAIDFAIAQGHVDTSRIFVNGVSGGGYAALAVYMRSRHPIHSISAWVPISDLEAWYHESRIRNNPYAEHILKCTNSAKNDLDTTEARKRSPLYWQTPDRDTKLQIFTGIYDGIQGSVPITHSINFYNKLIKDLETGSLENRVTTEEKAALLEYRKPLRDYGKIGSRRICLERGFDNIRLVIFEGNHEMLPEEAFRILKED